ncbi:MAG: helix-turn-helix transcriptional regulator [Armatimonadota bacterium]|nr:helix-turn-helix transcriptional regulator [Armatimonadota bacterium]MDR5702280.1 helix-turn-helix transcriptional regulator [Armatimonadota bacterium]MDR7435401.1 helix-turn-helix transcriptional regulator [Armatimonadota bacterium]
MNMLILGTKIRDARRRRAMTVTALARYLGVTHAAVSQWEHGRYSPSKKHRALLSVIFPELKGEFEQAQKLILNSMPAGRNDEVTF